MTDLRYKIRELEADLHQQGVKLFPNTRAGHDAQVLWRKIKQHLFRGGAAPLGDQTRIYISAALGRRTTQGR